MKKKKERLIHEEAPPEAIPIEERDNLQFLILSALLLAVFLINLPFAGLEMTQPDSCAYLEMGRNLFTGKGAVVSYNIYQFWPGKYHAFLPYMQPLYGIIAGLIYLLFGLKTVIGFNILIHGINCAILYKIIRLYSDTWTSFLIALYMGFSRTILFSTVFPLTEQLHLFSILSAIFIYLRYDRHRFLAGALLALSLLVRTASIYNIFAFGIGALLLRGLSRDALKEYLGLSLGFLAVLLSYELFCYLRYGIFYPEYLTAAKTYTLSYTHFGAFYKESLPVLNMPPIEMSVGSMAANVQAHLNALIEVFGGLKFLLILAPVYAIYDLFERKRPLFIIFSLQGICTMLGYALGLYWFDDIEAIRYLLIPLIMLGPAGFLAIREISGGLFSYRLEKRFPVPFIIIMLIFFGFQFRDYSDFRDSCFRLYRENYAAYFMSRDNIYEWVKANSAEDDLIATSLLRDAFLLERPIISLPRDTGLTRKAMIDYLKVYNPKYVITHDKECVRILKGIGFFVRKVSGGIAVLDKGR